MPVPPGSVLHVLSGGGGGWGDPGLAAIPLLGRQTETEGTGVTSPVLTITDQPTEADEKVIGQGSPTTMR